MRLPFSVFWSGMSGNTHALAQILVLSVVTEILVLAAPFYMQLTVDEVIARGDVDFPAHTRAWIRAPPPDQSRVDCDPLVHYSYSAEHVEPPDRRPAVSSSGAFATLLFRKAAHGRHPVALRLDRAHPQHARGGTDHGLDRRPHVGVDAGADVHLHRSARICSPVRVRAVRRFTARPVQR